MSEVSRWPDPDPPPGRASEVTPVTLFERRLSESVMPKCNFQEVDENRWPRGAAGRTATSTAAQRVASGGAYLRNLTADVFGLRCSDGMETVTLCSGGNGA